MKKVIIGALLLTSCSDMFDTHPYDIHFDGETDINAKQIAKIESQFAEKDTLRVAFISDTHGWYSDTKDEVADLNQRTDINFVIHCGDLTDTGTSLPHESSLSVSIPTLQSMTT